LLEYCRTHTNPCERVYSVEIGRCVMQVMDHGDERVIVRREHNRVQNWHRSQVSYDTLIKRFNQLFDEQLARRRL